MASVCAAALCLLAWFSQVATEQAVAQDQGRSSLPERLWEAYPLDPTPDPRAEPTAAPAAVADSGRRPTGTAATGTDGGAPAGLLILLALIPAGGTLAFLWTRRMGENEPQAATATVTAPSAAARGARPLWHGPLASVGTAKGISPTDGARASQAAAVPRAAAAALVGEMPEADPGASGPAPPSPPDGHRAWTAEIEWRHTHAESRFCVIARSGVAGKTAVAQSPPLEWPPTGPDSVQALTDAAEGLEASLVAAGWKTLAPGRAWYSKRFAWEPVEATADRVGAPSGSNLDTDDAGLVHRFRRVMRSSSAGARRPVGRGKVPVAAVLGLLVAAAILGLLLGGSVGGDDGSAARPPAASKTDSPRQRPAAGTQAGSTQARNPAARTQPAASTSKGTDLTLPLLALLGLLTIGLAIRQILQMQR